MPIQVFVDESGGKGQGPWIVLVGVMGKTEDWAAFADRWRTELDRPPAIRSLHMREAANLEGDFKRWLVESRNERVFALASLVNDYRLPAVSSAIDVSAYEEIIGKKPRRASAKSKVARIGKIVGDPYFLCFHSIIMATCYELLEQGVNERFEIIFDEHRILGPRVKTWYPVFRSFMEPEEQAIMPVEPIFRDDNEFVPLQVADLLAWLIRREMDGLDHSFGWIPIAMRGITWSGHVQVFDRARLQGIYDLSVQQPISDVVFYRTNRLLGLEEEQPS